MKEEKKGSILSIVFQIFGLTAIIIFTFMGCIYTFNDLKVAGLISLLLVIIVVILSNQLVYWKTKAATNNKDLKNRRSEKILLIFYLIIALFTFLFANHYFAIEFYRKGKIKHEMDSKIKEFDNLNLSYRNAVDSKIKVFKTTVDQFKNDLKNSDEEIQKEAILKLDLLLDPGRYNSKDTSSVSIACSDMERIKLAGYRVDSLSKSKEEYMQNVKTIYENWEILKVGYNYTGIDTELNDYLVFLQKLMPDFSYKLSKQHSEFTNPLQSFQFNTVLNIVICFLVNILVHFFILGKYLTSKRSDLLIENKNNQVHIEGDLFKKLF